MLKTISDQASALYADPICRAVAAFAAERATGELVKALVKDGKAVEKVSGLMLNNWKTLAFLGLGYKGVNRLKKIVFSTDVGGAGGKWVRRGVAGGAAVVGTTYLLPWMIRNPGKTLQYGLDATALACGYSNNPKATLSKGVSVAKQVVGAAAGIAKQLLNPKKGSASAENDKVKMKKEAVKSPAPETRVSIANLMRTHLEQQKVMALVSARK